MNGFLGSAILETAIGTVFVYLLLAVFCTAAVEWTATLLQARSKTLRETMGHLLRDQNLTEGVSLLEAFYGHPIISSVMQEGAHPAYFSPQAFSTAILDLAHGAQGCFEKLAEGPIRTALLALFRKAQGDGGALETGVEAWFNDAMRRASACYQKRIRVWTLAVAFGVTIATNADTLVILHHPGRLPGWSGASFYLSPSAFVARLTGWTLTAAAVSLGAPFWFDVMSRFVNLRAGTRPAQPTS